MGTDFKKFHSSHCYSQAILPQCSTTPARAADSAGVCEFSGSSMSLVSTMTTGVEWLVDAEGCRPAALRDLALMRRLCEQVIRQLDLHVIGEGRWHQFPGPGGLTGLFLLTESHFACHTYPETGTATFNLYCCRPRPDWPWQKELRELLGAVRVSVRRLPRGSEDAAAFRKEDQDER